MHVVAVGLSHRTAPVDVREKVVVAPTDLPEVLAGLKATRGIFECLLVSTCNRTELYAVVEEPHRDSARMSEIVSEFGKIPLSDLETHIYVHHGVDAVRHLFRVSSSLDSMIVGESQILGQMKAAFAAAQAAETASAGMSRIMQRAFAVAKAVRTSTKVGESAVSASSVAVDLAQTIFGDLSGRSVLIAGAGEMGQLTLRHLQAAGVRSVYVANRSRERAEEVLATLDDDVDHFYVPLEEIGEAVAKVDIAISSVQAGRYLLDGQNAAAFLGGRRRQPLLLVDIAVPRSFDPALHELDNVFLYDIDDLGKVVERNVAVRTKEATRAERHIDKEAHAFVAGLKELDVVPTIRAVVDRFERIRAGELDRHRGRLEALDDEAWAAVDSATKAMLKKIAHGAIQELKRSVAAENGDIQIETLKRAFAGDDGARKDEEQ